MQGQRSSIEPFPEAFGFEPGSSSTSPEPISLDSQLYWNNMLLNPVDQPDFPQLPYLAEPDPHHPLPGSSHHNPEPVASLSLENVDMNINLNANFSDLPSQVQNTDASELRLYQHGHGHSPFFGSGSSSMGLNSGSGHGIGLEEDMDSRPGSSTLDGRRLACKRKNIEIGAHAQASASGSTSNLHLHGAGAYTSSSSSYHPYQNPNPSSIVTGTNIPSVPVNYINPADEPFPGFRTPVTASGVVAGNSQRSFRIRTGPTMGPTLHQDLGAPGLAPPNLWSHSNNTSNNNTGTDQGSYINNGNNNNVRRFNLWGPPPLFHSPVETVPHLDPPVLGFGPGNVPPPVSVSTHQFPRNGASSSRVGSASSPIDLESGFAEFTPSNPVGEFVTAGGQRVVRGGASSSVNWDDERERVASSSSVRERGGTSSSVSPPVGPTWASSQGLHARYHRNLSEDIGGRIGGPPALRGQQGPPPRLRSAYVMERHSSGDGVWGVPLSLRSREGRRIIEIRNALEFMRRGDNLRFESIYYGGIEMHDRHRDMRLDIDNMSYEELLALEERIGNVSTGLTDEIVAKLLKQHKYTSHNRETSSMEEEPCCICQEEYVEGDELGRLDCGHDFHTSCIKQWLTHKNLCPICKNTALIT
ncbi:hypothetical protein LUZ61_008351 [Rhynchospora tenuis]|uniref:RING-type E3 ubiquitin transferase n=1 Tax=Rhynchospora tenuis TaxID=198213 RepID=A0AAD5ZV84_9POAL|nr:hypothetical protein LUZ61_008351 [Rhynchospora tenuis]